MASGGDADLNFVALRRDFDCFVTFVARAGGCADARVVGRRLEKIAADPSFLVLDRV